MNCTALTGVFFAGDAPTEENAFKVDTVGGYINPPDLTLYYIEGKDGWTTPTWNGYPTAIWNPDGHTHSYTDAVTAPTCTERGYTTHTCECGYSYVDTYVDELGHDYSEWTQTQAPTCTDDGVKTFTCTACGETKTETVEKLGHDYQATVIAPTCTEQGYTTHTCSRCGDAYSDTYVDATGHNIANGICTVCGLKSPTVTVESITAAPGETVTVPVVISNNGGFAGFTFVFAAEAPLSITKIAKGDLLQTADSGSFAADISDGIVTWRDSVNTVGDGTLMLLTVTVDDDAQDGEYCIQAFLKDNNEINFADEGSQAIPVTFGAGTISVESAPEEAKLTISGNPVTVTPGSTITVPVMISGGESFAGFTFTISASEGLTLKSIEKGALLEDADGMFTKNIAQKTVNWTCSENLIGDGELMLLTFDVSETANEGDLTISIHLKDNKPTNMVNADEKPVSTRFEDILVTVSLVIYGDTNGDGEVDTADAVRLVRYLVDLVELTEPQKLAADVNHDNDLTSADSIRLVRYLVGFVDTLDTTAAEQPARARTAKQATTGATVEIGTVSGEPGATVTVPVTISGNTGFAGFTLEVSYPETLTLTKATKGSLLKDSDSGALTSNLAKNLINWNDVENLTGDGQLLVLTFMVDDLAANGDYTVSIAPKDGKPGNFVDEEGSPVSLAFHPGTVTVSAHEHKYIDVVTPPTCTEQGYTTHTCSTCGNSYVDAYVDALGHDWSDWTVTTAPTCTEKGVETRTCSRCKETETREVAALGHDLIHHDAKAQTCTEIGWNAYDTCSRCDYTTYEELPILSHNPGAAKKENNVEPTCTEAGGYDMVVRCTRCNGILESTHTDVPALGHDWSDWTVTTAPTCTEKGVETRTCSRCKETETREVAALGHDLISHEAKAPTCTEIGWNAYDTCSRCDYTTYKEIPALGHDWSDWTVTTAPTCTEKGAEKRACSRCSENETREVAALGHDLISHEAKAPTCTEIGWDAYDTCSRCDYTTYEELPALGHNPGQAKRENNVEPTCTASGKYDMVVRCTRCNGILESTHTDVPALGHNWSDWTVTTAPTCTEKGAETRACSRCSESETREVAALGHDLIHHEAKAPTCTEVGWSAYDTCSRCDYTTYREIPALGHNWSDWTIAMDPVFAGKNVEIRTCTRCNMTETRELDLECNFVNFSDCRDSWYHEAVDFVVYKGLMGGVGHNKFDPSGTMTRAMMVTVLYRMVGSPAVDGSSTFSDVPTGQWYSEAISWAQSNGIVGGIGHNLFAPEAPVTREDLATILWRSQGSPATSADLSGFRDSGTIDSYAYGAMQWAVAVGILNGDAGRLKPVDSATRAEFACIIMRYLKGSYVCTER